jgi:predicted HAD superfamily Cof-like phosphohydrolase
LDYVVEGTRLEFGIDGESIAEEVHRTNMLKTDGPTSPEGKRLKPPGWEPPRIAMILEVQKNLWALGEIAADVSDEEEGRNNG